MNNEKFMALPDDLKRVVYGQDPAIEQLTGPYEDTNGRPYYLSEERVRAIVYEKGRTDGSER